MHGSRACRVLQVVILNCIYNENIESSYYYNSQNELVRKGGLFIFEVMLRIDDEDHVPFNVIDDYPF